MKPTKFFSPKTRAFTLVELLAVVVVFGILVALLVPATNSFIARAQGTACAANMRPLAAALFAYRGEHNGWFPPGYPAAPTVIKDAAGNILNSGPAAANFNATLVPQYLDELPICPTARLQPDESKKFPDTKKRFQTFGGTYGINAILLQWKIEAMPPPPQNMYSSFSASKMPFLLEIGAGSATWSFEHQAQALNGVLGWHIMGRNHGHGDTLNFMFLDGHMEAISRNDPRDVPEVQKSWLYPKNPNGKFQAWGQNGKYYPATRMTEAQFIATYPQYDPNPGP